MVKSEYDDRFLKALSNVVSFVTNEAVVLAQYETVQEGRFAWLWPADDNGEFDERVHRVVEHLGGPSQLYVIGNDEEPPLIDNYPAAAMREAIAVFSRARKSVLRAHLFMAGSSLLAEKPGVMELPENPDVAAAFIREAQAAFWEHAEAAYIRLASFWDRVGQVLDFAFFNRKRCYRRSMARILTGWRLGFFRRPKLTPRRAWRFWGGSSPSLRKAQWTPLLPFVMSMKPRIKGPGAPPQSGVKVGKTRRRMMRGDST
jgi:hypothetical protein